MSVRPALRPSKERPQLLGRTERSTEEYVSTAKERPACTIEKVEKIVSHMLSFVPVFFEKQRFYPGVDKME